MTVPIIDTQPHSTEAEQTVIGALILDPDAVFKVETQLSPHDFYDPTYRDIYAAITAVSQSGIPIDVVTVAVVRYFE